MDSKLVDASAVEQSERIATLLDVVAPETNDESSPNTTDTVYGEGSDRVIDSGGIECGDCEDNNDVSD